MITLDELKAEFHSVKISDGSGNDLAIDASGYITVKGSGNFNVTATDLDIRDLTSASDSVEIKTAAGQALAIDGSGYLTVNGNGTFTVSATDLDVRDLTHVSDSVKIGDGTDFLAINADGSLNVATVQAGLDSWQTSVVSATTTAAEIAATPLANRKKMIIQNLGNNDVYLGENNAVTTSNGIKLPKGSSLEFEFGDGSDVWCLTSSGTADLRVSEHA